MLQNSITARFTGKLVLGPAALCWRFSVPHEMPSHSVPRGDNAPDRRWPFGSLHDWILGNCNEDSHVREAFKPELLLFCSEGGKHHHRIFEVIKFSLTIADP